MKVTRSTVQRIEITDAPRLDPIRVYVEDYGDGKGRITISCYDAAWVGYWGAMGCSLVEFFTSASTDYLASNLGCASSLRRTQQTAAYLIRVVEAVQSALREVAHAA
jgi:hypothetical protein